MGLHGEGLWLAGRSAVNAVPMIRRCHRHQHPECHGGAEVREPSVPPTLRYGLGGAHGPVCEAIAQEAMGNGEVLDPYDPGSYA